MVFIIILYINKGACSTFSVIYTPHAELLATKEELEMKLLFTEKNLENRIEKLKTETGNSN